jgi:hypothetical protein
MTHGVTGDRDATGFGKGKLKRNAPKEIPKYESAPRAKGGGYGGVGAKLVKATGAEPAKFEGAKKRKPTDAKKPKAIKTGKFFGLKNPVGDAGKSRPTSARPEKAGRNAEKLPGNKSKSNAPVKDHSKSLPPAKE